MRLGAFVGGLLMGGLAGAAIGILTAPKSGDKLREDLVEASDELYRRAKYEIEELSDKYNVERKIDKAQEALQKTNETNIHSHQILEQQSEQRMS
jgi:gas vesicle protein